MKALLIFPRPRAAFTLVELMVSVSVLALIMLVLMNMTNQITQTWRSTTGKIEQFQEARDGFESMTRKLSQATLNTHWDLFYTSAGSFKVPRDFIRQSQLRFVSGPMDELARNSRRPTHGVFFQAPLGFVEDTQSLGRLENLLNTWGYFIEISDDSEFRPSFLTGKVPTRYKAKLMELMQPSEEVSVYDLDYEIVNGPTQGKPPEPGSDRGAKKQLSWFTGALNGTGRPVRVVADNIIALVIWPRISKLEEDERRDLGQSVLSPNYLYDSTLFTFSSANYGSGSTSVYLNEGTSSGDVDENRPEVAGQISPKNQLPPVLQVTMVALDDASAQRLVDKSGENALAQLTNGLFEVACRSGTKSNQETQYEKDLKTLEERLTKDRLTYRVFTTTVPIRGAKWSAFQSK